jgi:hypothetical protein
LARGRRPAGRRRCRPRSRRRPRWPEQLVQNVVVAETADHFVETLASIDEVMAVAAEQPNTTSSLMPDAGAHRVVACVAVDSVVTGRVGDDVVGVFMVSAQKG